MKAPTVTCKTRSSRPPALSQHRTPTTAPDETRAPKYRHKQDVDSQAAFTVMNSNLYRQRCSHQTHPSQHIRSRLAKPPAKPSTKPRTSHTHTTRCVNLKPPWRPHKQPPKPPQRRAHHTRSPSISSRPCGRPNSHRNQGMDQASATAVAVCCTTGAAARSAPGLLR